jgi:hypothetical protein
MPTPNTATALGKIAQDFFKIEVNTIIKEGMSAETVPPMPLALLDIAQGYIRWLRPKLEKALPGYILIDPQGAYIATFCDLVVAASVLETIPNLSEADLAIASRIRCHSEAIIAMLGGIFEVQPDQQKTTGIRHKLWSFLEPIIDSVRSRIGLSPKEPVVIDKAEIWKNLFEKKEDELRKFIRNNTHLVDDQLKYLGFTPADISVVAKIWDIGTETIIMQSVLHISGDMFTRVSGSYVSSQYESLHQTHFKSVGVSIEAWGRLTELLTKLGGALIGFASKRG